MYLSSLSLRKCVSVNDAKLDYTPEKANLRPKTKSFKGLRQLVSTYPKEQPRGKQVVQSVWKRIKIAKCSW